MDLSTCSHTAGAGARGRGTASGRVARAVGRAGCVALTALALILTALVSAAPAEAATLGATAAMRTTSVGVGPALEYCGNARVEDALASVRTVVLVVHGDGRDACPYADSTLKAASGAGMAGSTLVIAPHFLASSDGHSGRMYWSESGWKTGDASLDTGRLSSFAVVDRLLAGVTTARYPNLQRIVVAGHSAGGQFVNRYEATTPNNSVTRYVVANPSSYLYFGAKRFSGTTLRSLTSSEQAACRRYNDYKYGLNSRNAYTGGMSEQTLRDRFASRPTTLLLGTADTSRGGNLDMSCAADWQGANRYERGHRYHDVYLPAQFGSGIASTHRISDVPAVGHSWSAMARSAQGRAALFTEPSR
jgi:pimeloyl-ACP methyl ester carboxylesterase